MHTRIKIAAFFYAAAVVEAQTVHVNLKNKKFGVPFNVRFTNPNPTITNWIGIYAANLNLATNSNEDLLWSSMCDDGDQDKWNTASCPPQSSGVIRFRVQDPDLDSNDQFPLNPGNYKACIMDGETSPYTVVKCKWFKINPLQNKAMRESTLAPTKSTYSSGETISAEFFSRIPVFNSWIGLYGANDVDNDSSELPTGSEEISWVYANCNNQAGDQDPESEDCAKRRKRGVVTFDGTTDDQDLSWPLPGGNYRFCLSFFTNPPFKKFICSDAFAVEEGDDDSPGGDDITLDVASSIPFGNNIAVSFTNPNPLATNWIGIYDPATVSSYTNDDLHWASMCGDQTTWNAGCGPKSSGSITFSGADPDQESGEQWPLSPGLREVCFMSNDGVAPSKCETFTIEDIPNSVINESSLYATASTYSVGDDITVSFDAAKAIQNTWIGYYRASDISAGMSALPGEPLLWVYSACNNRSGDQSETNNCQLKKTSGTVQINISSTTPTGLYYVCMSFYNNTPYSKYVCSTDTFRVV